MEKLNLTYSVAPSEWLEGYDLYYKAYRKKFTYIKAAIFLIPLLLFAQQIFIDPYYTLGWICIIVCIGAIACILATPKLERKNSERALEALRDDKYHLTLTDKKLTVSTIIPESDEQYLEYDKDGNQRQLPEIPPTVVELDEKGLKLIETGDIFVVMSKSINLVVPKAAMSENETNILRGAFPTVNKI